MSEPVGSSEEKQFFAEVSKHGRASCKKCKQKCLQGELRIAKLVPSPSSVDKIKNWYHIDCIFETFLNQRQTTKRIENAHDIVGLDNLSAEHKSRILNKILECNEALELKASAKSARRQKSSKKATITVSVNNEDAISCSSSDISNSRESHEDNLFREFRIIIDKVGKKDSASEKTKVIRELFTKGSDGKGFKSDVYLWCKLLLPSIERRTVDLKTNLILKIFSQIFQKNLNDMLEHLKKSDLGQTIHYYFEHNKAVKPAKKSYLTMQEVDEFLEELLVLKREQKQIDLFKSLAKRCTANDLKVVVRWIRDDLRMSTETKQILDGVHPNAYKMFQSSNDLKSAIENCLNPPPTEITENVEDNDNKVTAKKRKTGSNSTNKSEAPVKRRNRRKLLEAPRKKKKKIDNIAKQEDFDAIFDRLKNSVTVPVKPIPNYFQGMKVLLENGVAECQAECVRYFIAYGGALLTSDQYEEATHVLHLRDTLRQPTTACPSSARHVIVKWIKDTVENDCLQDFRPYTVRWDPNFV